MTAEFQVRFRIGEVIFTFSALAWLSLLIVHHRGDMLSWFIMLVAMMAPLLIYSLHHVWYSSFKRRRARALGLFVLGYVSVWMLAGFLIQLMKAMLGSVLPQSFWPALIILLVAIIWQCSPIKQRCLNRNHNHRALRAFGLSADIDALRFGLTHGAWCLGSCWALMLLPTFLVHGHLVAMGLVTYIMLSDSLDRPSQPKWHVRIPRKLAVIIFEQGKILLRNRLTMGSPAQPDQVV